MVSPWVEMPPEPRERVLIVRVDQRPVDVEQGRLDRHYLAAAPTGALAKSSTSSRLNAGVALRHWPSSQIAV